MYLPSSALLALQGERTRTLLSRYHGARLVSRQHQEPVIQPPIRRLLLALRLPSSSVTEPVLHSSGTHCPDR